MNKRILIWDDADFESCFTLQKVRPYIDVLHGTANFRFCSTQELATVAWNEIDVFVSFYGGFFPQKIFPSIEHFLKAGKGFLCFNGAPFRIPCSYNDTQKRWVAAPSCLTFLRKINIHSVLDVDTSSIVSNKAAAISNIMDGFCYFDKQSCAQNLIMIPTKDKYFEKEWGSTGSMDSRILALIKGFNSVGEHRSSPAVLIQHRAGAFTGGQWIFCTQKLSGQIDDLFVPRFQKICRFLQQSYLEVILQPSNAIYHDSEMPCVRLNFQQYGKSRKISIALSVKNSQNQIVAFLNQSVRVSNDVDEILLPVTQGIRQGIYKIELNISDADGIEWCIRQGFLHGPFQETSRFSPISAGHDYFIQDEKPFAVVGMTYMSGERSRAFLHLPNTDLWLREMQQMKSAGVNWIRTGIWSNWRTYMLDDGHMDECVLRSLEAFVTCAAICGLHVTFTFFSFVPEMWEGTHPYLDPRCINAQKRFIAHIVFRLKDFRNIDWDLINEPYVCTHPTINRTPDDCFEKAAYIKYLKEKYHNRIEDYTTATGVPAQSFNDLEIPSQDDINFSVTDVSYCKNGLVWRDYIEFTHEIFRHWICEMTAYIKKLTSHMVTVGQDEALRGARPVPMTYGDLLDYDAQHTWWYLQDLAWDTIFTKSSHRPLLVQETGIMYTENADSSPRRQETDLAALLRKKYAYAFATKCAGVIQWIWNSNYYMQSANESNIGALRCDGSYKPEVDVTKDFAEFFQKCRPYLSDIGKNKVAVVFPFSNDFSNRRLSQLSTTNITKVLTNYLRIGFDGISEFQIGNLAPDEYEILILPSPHNLSVSARHALKKLLNSSHTKVLFTGAICMDENYHELTGEPYYHGREPIRQWESVTFDGRNYSFPFGSDVFMSAFKENFPANQVSCYKIGESTLYHLNVPVELSYDLSAIASLYSDLLRTMDYTPDFTLSSEQNLDCIFTSGVRWNSATLYTLINESGQAHELSLSDTSSHTKVHLKIESDGVRMFVLSDDGRLAVSDGGPLTILSGDAQTAELSL